MYERGADKVSNPPPTNVIVWLATHGFGLDRDYCGNRGKIPNAFKAVRVPLYVVQEYLQMQGYVLQDKQFGGHVNLTAPDGNIWIQLTEIRNTYCRVMCYYTVQGSINAGLHTA